MTEGVVDQSCRVEMLGGLRLFRADHAEPVTHFALKKAAALLGYLALTRRPQPRERIIDLFWPDKDPTAARDNLSTTLGSLRRQLELPGGARNSVLIADHTQVGLNPAAVSTDVADFERLLDRAAAAANTTAQADLLQKAIDLYIGDLLPGFYDDWALGEGVRLQSKYSTALRRLCDAREELQDLTGALEAARRLVATDAYSEEAHVRLIRLLMHTGHPLEASEAYRKAAALFEEEFGAPLSPASRNSIETVLAQTAPLPADPSAASPQTALHSSAHNLRLLPDSEATADSMPADETPGGSRGAESPSLPLILARFFGREAELSQMAGLLLPFKGVPEGAEAPPRPGRLVTLIGLGGNGKTRLALEFLHQASERLQCWCGFVSLADLSAPSQIPERIASALKIRLAPANDVPPLDQVVERLAAQCAQAGRPAMLALDNLEHLLPSDEGPDRVDIGETGRIVQAVLEGVPGLAILCTSRQRLGLRGERLVPVGPLAVPEAGEEWASGAELLLSYPGVRLYLDRAQAVRPDFTITASNATAVASLCRYLEGSPLAIELAAAWVRMLPPRKMWERLQQGLEIPEGGYTDLPARHRSLHAALEWSYRLLSPAAQRFLARLCVFTGGWTLEAATAVAGDGDEFDTLQLLFKLQEASLISVQSGAETLVGDEEVERYRVLETVRAFSRQRLQELEELEARRRRHALYFLEFAVRAEPELRGPQQAAWLSRLAADHDNLRSALSFLLDSTDPADAEAALRLTAALARFWQVRGHWREGRRRMEETLSRTAALVGGSAMRARVMNGVAGFAREEGDYARSRELYEAIIAMYRTLGDRARVGDTMHNLGLLALVQGDYVRARAHYEESLAIAREVGDTIGVADELHHLGWIAQDQGERERALALYEESLATRRPLGDQRGIAFTLHNLGNLYFELQDMGRSRALHEESLAIRRELGDRKGLAASYGNLARIALEAGDPTGARELGLETLKICDDLGEVRELISALYGLADAEVALDRVQRAASLFGAAEALWKAGGLDLARDSQTHTRWIAQAWERLGIEGYERYHSAGTRMTLPQAVAFAVDPDAN
jgi:predicted ATPase/DNA-binding SARP family transcriptional activator